MQVVSGITFIPLLWELKKKLKCVKKVRDQTFRESILYFKTKLPKCFPGDAPLQLV